MNLQDLKSRTAKVQDLKLQESKLQDLAPRASEAETFLKAIANRYRLMVLCELHKGERSVSALQQAVGLTQSSLSQHLAKLRSDGLVVTRREAQTIHYSLGSTKVTRMIALLYEIYCGPSCAEPARRTASARRRAASPRRAKQKERKE